MTSSPSASIDWSAAERWYDAHAESYELSTLMRAASPALINFAKRLTPGTKVLDAGCGCGRDTRWLLDRGFAVAAFDISREMVASTKANTAGRVIPRWLDFRDYGDAPGSWDAIWAMASLLHLPKADIADILPRLVQSLTDTGLLAISVKKGSGESMDDQGRPFSYFSPEEITTLALASLPGPGEVSLTVSTQPDGAHVPTAWIDVLIQRKPT